MAQPDELARLAETAQPAELALPIGRNDKYLHADMQQLIQSMSVER